MNIIIHDYAGHPFQVELSRNLASRGHHVTHIYFAGDRGPKGNMKLLMTDSDTLSIEAVGSQDYSKTNFMLRRRGRYTLWKVSCGSNPRDFSRHSIFW